MSILRGEMELPDYLEDCLSNQPVDPRIALLVETMNKTGTIRTVASCQGHGQKDFPPHVLFESPAEIAEELDGILKNLYFGSSRSLSKQWKITRVPRGEQALYFRLHSPAYDALSRSVLGSLVGIAFSRHKIDRDFYVIRKLLEDRFSHSA